MVINPFGQGHPGPSGSMQPPPHLLQSLEALHQHHLKLVSADQVHNKFFNQKQILFEIISEKNYTQKTI